VAIDDAFKAARRQLQDLVRERRPKIQAPTPTNDTEEHSRCDENSAARSFYSRSLSTNEGMAWRARRWTRFGVQMGVYAMRRARASVALLVRDHKPRRNAATGQVSESSPMPR
jgi:hypothetical protein